MKKLSPEEKHKIVQRYLHEPISYRELSKEVGIDESSLRYWTKLYEYHGDQAFTIPYTNYSVAFKLKVIQFIEETDYSIREAAAIFQLPNFSTARKWMKKWREGGYGALETQGKGYSVMTNHKPKKSQEPLTQEDMKKIQEENEYLRMENAYLKKLRALVQEEGKSPKGKKRK